MTYRHSNRAGNSWIEFLKEHKGEYTREELSNMYRKEQDGYQTQNGRHHNMGRPKKEEQRSPRIQRHHNVGRPRKVEEYGRQRSPQKMQDGRHHNMGRPRKEEQRSPMRRHRDGRSTPERRRSLSLAAEERPRNRSGQFI